MTDVVGALVEVGDDELAVRRRDGEVVRVRTSDVVAAKRLPPVPGGRPGAGLRIDPEALQDVTDIGWPATLTLPLGQWRLRAAGGFTGRANSASVHGHPGRSPQEAMQAVREFYASVALPAMAQVVVGSDWDQRFADAGWRTKPGGHTGAVVQVASVRHALRTATGGGDVRLHGRVDADWLRLYNRADERDPDVVRAVLEGPEQVRFARIGADPAMAIGRLVVTGDWAGVSAVEVAPEHRRRGLARQVVDALLGSAVTAGARWCYLQTMPDNTAALRLYEPYGFVTHHRYHYVVPGV